MQMNELARAHELDVVWPVADTMQPPELVVAIVGDNEGQGEEPSQDHIDTSFVPAAENRVDEPEEVALPTADDITKPPIDLSGGKTTFEDPEENNDGPLSKAAEEAGAVATGAEMTPEAEATPASDNLEITRHADGSTTVVNKAHSQELLEKVVARLEDEEPWTELPLRTDPEHPTKYFADSAEDPSFFAKVTSQLNEPEGLKEIELASYVQSVVSSEQAQRIVQDHGFSSVSYVEPLVVIDKPGEQQTIVYPYQAGVKIDFSEDPVETARAEELCEVVNKLNGLLAANGVNACDIEHHQFIAEGDDLYLLDAEHYERFEPPPPTLSPGKISNSIYGRWEEDAGFTEIYRGETVVARQSEDGSGVQLSTNLQEGYVVALWNTHTSESALLHVQSSMKADEQIRGLTERVPSMVSRGTVAHIVGSADFSVDTEHYPLAISVDTAVYLRSQAAQVSFFDPEGSSRVSMDTSNGSLEITTETGEIKRFTPPKRIS